MLVKLADRVGKVGEERWLSVQSKYSSIREAILGYALKSRHDPVTLFSGLTTAHYAANNTTFAS